MARKKVNGVGAAPSLNPAARPVDTYVRPQEPAPPVGPAIGPNPLTQIASALSSFSAGLGAESKRDKERRRVALRANSQAVIMAMTPAQVSSANATGKYPGLKTEYENENAAVIAGTRDSQQFNFDMIKRLSGQNTAQEGTPSNAYSPTSGVSREEFVADAYGKAYQNIKHPFAAQAFNQTYFKNYGSITNAIAKLNTDEQNQKNTSSIYVGAQTTIDQGIADKLPPEQIVKNTATDIQTLKERFNKTGPEMNEIVLTLASKYANDAKNGGNLEIVTGLLKSARSDGTPSLHSIPEYQRKVDAVIGKATELNVKRAKAQNHEASLQGLYSAYDKAAEAGVVLNVPQTSILTETGKEKVIDNKTGREMWRDNYLNVHSQNFATENNETPSEKYGRELRVLSTNGLKHPGWETILKNGYNTFSNMADANGEIPSASIQAVALWDRLSADNPAYANSLVPQEAKKFYRVYSVAKNLARLDTPTALHTAHNYTLKKDQLSTPGNSLSSKQLQDGLSDLDLDNVSTEMRTEFKELAEMRMIVGSMSKGDAMKAASEDLNLTYKKIGSGYMKFTDPRYSAISQRMKTDKLPVISTPDLMNKFLELRQSQVTGIEGEDLSLRHVDGKYGMFVVVDATGQPVWFNQQTNEKIKDNKYVGIEEIYQWYSDHSNAERQQAISQTKEDALNLNQPLINTGLIVVGRPGSDYKQVFKNAEEQTKRGIIVNPLEDFENETDF